MEAKLDEIMMQDIEVFFMFYTCWFVSLHWSLQLQQSNNKSIYMVERNGKDLKEKMISIAGNIEQVRNDY
jgi:hypothetical protein